jgi:hypothetical protein
LTVSKFTKWQDRYIFFWMWMKSYVFIFTDTLEAQSLYQFAHSQDFQESDENSTNKTDPSCKW